MQTTKRTGEGDRVRFLAMAWFALTRKHLAPTTITSLRQHYEDNSRCLSNARRKEGRRPVATATVTQGVDASRFQQPNSPLIATANHAIRTRRDPFRLDRIAQDSRQPARQAEQRSSQSQNGTTRLAVNRPAANHSGAPVRMAERSASGVLRWAWSIGRGAAAGERSTIPSKRCPRADASSARAIAATTRKPSTTTRSDQACEQSSWNGMGKTAS